MEIVIATHNNDKLQELLKAFNHHFDGVKLLTLNDFPEVEEIVEDGKTLEENALIKAKEVFNITGIPALSDDTGLEVDALNGAPGVYTARYAGEGCSYYDNTSFEIPCMQVQSCNDWSKECVANCDDCLTTWKVNLQHRVVNLGLLVEFVQRLIGVFPDDVGVIL